MAVKAAQRVAVVGAGWAGMAAAVEATRLGHQVTVFEAARTLGGRARAVHAELPDGATVVLDNGQHILIGAYRESLALMRTVGVDPGRALQRLPLTLLQPDGSGLALPDWPAPLDALAGIWSARGWSLADKWSLSSTALRWQMQGFVCKPAASVADLCRGLRPAVMQGFIDPLCVSALNTPADRASGQVFLTVLRDSLLGGKGSSNLLLPADDLSALFPQAAGRWLQSNGASLHTGCRVEVLQAVQDSTSTDAAAQWLVQGQPFDRIVLATSPSAAVSLLQPLLQSGLAQTQHQQLLQWLQDTRALHFEAIATVYTWASGARLPHAMLALASDSHNPAQFVFDRGRLGGPAGLWAFVVSASQGSREEIQARVLEQACTQLGSAAFAAKALGTWGLDSPQPLQAVQTIVEKRATFACTPGLQRPSATPLLGVLACGDYVQGPYPATLEGAVRSGLAAARYL